MEVFDIQLKNEKLRIVEEENFVRLFHEVLEKNKGDLSSEAIAKGVEEIKKRFRRGISGSMIKVNLDAPEESCGFFYRYSPLFAGITRRRILTALRDCEKFRSYFRRASLKIVDVGSGAGSALVGLYSALDSFEENIDGEIVRGFPFQSLQVTAMDYVGRWETFFKDIEAKLRSTGYGNASRLFREKTIECLFRRCDMLNYGKLKDQKELNEADIIFMKGFLSVLVADTDRHCVCQAITSEMKLGSLLVIIESPPYEKYFQNENLRLVFTTRKYLPVSAVSLLHSTPQSASLGSQDSGLTAQAASFSSDDRHSASPSFRSESQAHDSALGSSLSVSDNVWEHYDPTKKPNNEEYRFSASEIRVYGPGLARQSNQQIFVLEKIQ